MNKKNKLIFAFILGAIALSMYVGIIIKTAYF